MPKAVEFIKNPPKKTISVVLRQCQIDQLKKISKDQKISVSRIVEQLIDKVLQTQ